KRPPSLAMPQPGGPLRVPGLAFASLKPVCVSRVTFRIADLTNPILKPWAIEEMREQNALAAAGKRAFEARANCRPGCVPGFLIMGCVNRLFCTGEERSHPDQRGRTGTAPRPPQRSAFGEPKDQPLWRVGRTKAATR